MAWAELDLDAALWTIPAMRMKRGIDGKTNGDPHLVPLPVQAVEILRKLHPLTSKGAKSFLFFGLSMKIARTATSAKTMRKR